jgi:hypothetical protein
MMTVDKIIMIIDVHKKEGGQAGVIRFKSCFGEGKRRARTHGARRRRGHPNAAYGSI